MCNRSSRSVCVQPKASGACTGTGTGRYGTGGRGAGGDRGAAVPLVVVPVQTRDRTDSRDGARLSVWGCDAEGATISSVPSLYR